MAKPRRLSKPPIREALVDIYVNSEVELKPETFAGLDSDLKPNYPIKEERRNLEAKFELKAGSVAAASRVIGFGGFFFKSADGGLVAQFRPDGFTLNRIGNYTTADELIAEAMRLWPKYLSIVKPTQIARIGLRYINDMTLPFLEAQPLEHFLTAAPNLPEEAPQILHQFKTNVLLTDGSTGATVRVNQNFAAGKTARYVLDIAATFGGPFELSLQIPERLQVLREVKNRVFFSMLTDVALDLYT